MYLLAPQLLSVANTRALIVNHQRSDLYVNQDILSSQLKTSPPKWVLDKSVYIHCKQASITWVATSFRIKQLPVFTGHVIKTKDSNHSTT